MDVWCDDREYRILTSCHLYLKNFSEIEQFIRGKKRTLFYRYLYINLVYLNICLVLKLMKIINNQMNALQLEVQDKLSVNITLTHRTCDQLLFYFSSLISLLT